MRTDEARAMAEELMAAHGLVGWSLVLDRARVRAGVCRPARREIGLSRVLTELHSPAEVRQTVLHEIAHALVGVGHGHDAVWRARAVAIGATGARCVPASAPRAPAPWVGTCPAGHEVGRHRRPERVASCSRCRRGFDPSVLITWRLRGEEVPMHPRYVAELARVRERAGVGGESAWAGGGDAGGGSRRPAVTGSAGGAGEGWLAALAAAAAAGSASVGEPPPRRSVGAPAASAAAIPVGTAVRLVGSHRFTGVHGVVEKRGRSRYHVRTDRGLLAAPFAIVEPLG